MELRSVQSSTPRTALIVAALGVVAAVIMSPQGAWPHELATAQGTITTSEAPAGQRSPACGELFVEARDALDNHLIAQTRPALAEDGTCRYAISVPAQSAVWLRLRPALVAAARATAPTEPAAPAAAAPFVPSPAAGHRISSRGVQIRFTVIAPATNFFTPGEHKTVPLTY